jgi:hypothetical protein
MMEQHITRVSEAEEAVGTTLLATTCPSRYQQSCYQWLKLYGKKLSVPKPCAVVGPLPFKQHK